MDKQIIYHDNLSGRRNFFQQNFPMIKISRQRVDVNSFEVLKNTCPVCGYMTLNERDAFDICGICFWEDDGKDDFEENDESGPNYMTLREGRSIFREAKRQLMSSDYGHGNYLKNLQDSFLRLDTIIDNGHVDKTEIMRLQNEILVSLDKNEVYGLETLFDDTKPNR